MKKPVKSGGATLISSAFCEIRHIRDAGSKTCRTVLSGEKLTFDLLHRHLFSGPEAERLGALVEEHVGTVEGRVSLMFCHGEESCLTRIVDDVGYDETVREDEIFRDRAGILVRGHADGGSVCEDGAVCEFLF